MKVRASNLNRVDSISEDLKSVRDLEVQHEASGCPQNSAQISLSHLQTPLNPQAGRANRHTGANLRVREVTEVLQGEGKVGKETASHASDPAPFNPHDNPHPCIINDKTGSTSLTPMPEFHLGQPEPQAQAECAVM